MPAKECSRSQKGSAVAPVDLMGGRIQVMYDTVAFCLPHIKIGKLRALAVATAGRSSTRPERPPCWP